MPLWTLYDKTKPPAEAVIREHEQNANGGIPGTTQAAESPEKPGGLSDELAWLQEQHNAEPAFDAATQKLQRDNGVVAIDPVDKWTGTRTWGWSVVDLSDQELRDADRRSKLASDAAAVGAIVDKWRKGNTVLQSAEVGKVVEFVALQNGLDEQAYQQ